MPLDFYMMSVSYFVSKVVQELERTTRPVRNDKLIILLGGMDICNGSSVRLFFVITVIENEIFCE